MAATVGNVERLGISGPGGPWIYGEITLDSSYAASGETVAATLFGLTYYKAVFVGSAQGGQIIKITLSSDKTSLTVVLWSTATTTTSATPITSQTEVAVGFDASSVVIPVLVRGM